MKAIIVLVLFASTAHAERWRFSGDFDVDTILQSGIGVALGATPARLPKWRFALAVRSHDVPDFQSGLSSSNDDLYVTMPIAIESVVQRRLDIGVVTGVRAGVVHLHFARIGKFGIDEEFDYGVTPFLGYEWRPADNVYVQPWLGAMLTVVRQKHGELPMQEMDRTYSKWPTALRGGIVVGARY